MTRRGQSLTLGVACLLAALVMYTQAGCGDPSKMRRTTLAGEVAAVKAARAVFHNWDVQQQQRIGTDATSREDGERKLDVYRKGRDNVTRAFNYVLGLLLDAATGEDEYSLAKARAAAADIVKGVAKLKPGEDPPPENTIPCGGFATTPSTECKDL